MKRSRQAAEAAKDSSRNSASSASGTGGRRRVIVFVGILAMLGLTSILLMAMAPTPMSPSAVNRLIGVDPLASIFNTKTPLQPDRWKFIYIHQSLTPGGDAMSLGDETGDTGDHFVLGNGDGCDDGEIQMTPRWINQISAAPPPGARNVDAACITICVVGDFANNTPTATQVHRLSSLVQALQTRCHIPDTQVTLLSSQGASAAGVGKHFPAAAFRKQLLNKVTVSE